jgi:hypothetical protein
VGSSRIWCAPSSSNDRRFDEKLIDVAGRAGTIDRQVPKGLQIHMILGNYGAHTHDNVVAWLDKHPRFHLPFVWTAT